MFWNGRESFQTHFVLYELHNWKKKSLCQGYGISEKERLPVFPSLFSMLMVKLTLNDHDKDILFGLITKDLQN